MPVIIAKKLKYAGTTTLSALNVETVVIDVPAQQDDYIVEGYVDVNALEPGDSITIREYVAIDGKNLRVFNTITLDGPTPEPAIRFHTKTLLSHMSYRVTITQTAGTPKSFPYAFIVELMGTAWTEMSCTQAYPANLVKLSYMLPAAITLPVTETIEMFITAACNAVHAIAQVLIPAALTAYNLEIMWKLTGKAITIARQVLEATLSYQHWSHVISPCQHLEHPLHEPQVEQ